MNLAEIRSRFLFSRYFIHKKSHSQRQKQNVTQLTARGNNKFLTGRLPCIGEISTRDNSRVSRRTVGETRQRAQHRGDSGGHERDEDDDDDYDDDDDDDGSTAAEAGSRHVKVADVPRSLQHDLYASLARLKHASRDNHRDKTRIRARRSTVEHVYRQVRVKQDNCRPISLYSVCDTHLQSAKVWHVLRRNRTILHATHTSIHAWNEPYIPAFTPPCSRRASPNFGWYSFPVPHRVGGRVGLGGWLYSCIPMWFARPRRLPLPVAY